MGEGGDYTMGGSEKVPQYGRLSHYLHSWLFVRMKTKWDPGFCQRSIFSPWRWLGKGFGAVQDALFDDGLQLDNPSKLILDIASPALQASLLREACICENG